MRRQPARRARSATRAVGVRSAPGCGKLVGYAARSRAGPRGPTGSSVEDAVALYERVYDSRDIHIGDVARDGFTFRFRAVGDHDVTMGSSVAPRARWGTISPGRD